MSRRRPESVSRNVGGLHRYCTRALDPRIKISAICIHHSHSLKGKGEVRYPGRAGCLNGSAAEITANRRALQEAQCPPGCLRSHRDVVGGELKVPGARGRKLGQVISSPTHFRAPRASPNPFHLPIFNSTRSLVCLLQIKTHYLVPPCHAQSLSSIVRERDHRPCILVLPSLLSLDQCKHQSPLVMNWTSYRPSCTRITAAPTFQPKSSSLSQNSLTSSVIKARQRTRLRT